MAQELLRGGLLGCRFCSAVAATLHAGVPRCDHHEVQRMVQRTWRRFGGLDADTAMPGLQRAADELRALEASMTNLTDDDHARNAGIVLERLAARRSVTA